MCVSLHAIDAARGGRGVQFGRGLQTRGATGGGVAPQPGGGPRRAGACCVGGAGRAGGACVEMGFVSMRRGDGVADASTPSTRHPSSRATVYARRKARGRRAARAAPGQGARPPRSRSVICRR